MTEQRFPLDYDAQKTNRVLRQKLQDLENKIQRKQSTNQSVSQKPSEGTTVDEVLRGRVFS